MKNTAIGSLFLVLSLIGCGEAPGDELATNSGTCADMGILVVAAQTCPAPADPNIVVCQADGSIPGGPANPVPASGCTVNLLRAPGQPYAATCVAACPSAP